MAEAIIGALTLVVIVGAIVLGFWALRRQSRQYPKDTRIPADDERKAESPSSAWMNLGGRG